MANEDKFLSFSDVSRITGGKSRTTIWRWCREGEFPKPRRIGPNSSAWLASEVQKWLDSKAAA